MRFRTLSLALAIPAVAILAGCATIPSGPSVLALPGTGKSFDQFRVDDQDCRQYANYQIGGKDANQAAWQSGATNAAIGTAVGAAAGALMGGHQGAGIGAGAGLIVGSAAGAGAGQDSGYALQRRYDHAFVQCMYAKGHRVPVSGNFTTQQAPAHATTEATIPPPPPGNPPPPPPGAPASR